MQSLCPSTVRCPFCPSGIPLPTKSRADRILTFSWRSSSGVIGIGNKNNKEGEEFLKPFF
jgi:hypothetical protein